MRAKFISEAFTEDSDPIHDMGIGIYIVRNFNSQKEIAQFLWKIFPALFGGSIPEDVINFGHSAFWGPGVSSKIERYRNKYITLNHQPFLGSWDVNNAIHNALIKNGYKVARGYEYEFKRNRYHKDAAFQIDE